jgi:hypothetical protein
MKLKLMLYVAVAVVILGLIKQYLLAGFKDEFFDSFIINLITDSLSILITVLLVGELIKKQEQKEKVEEITRQKKEQEKLINEIMGNRLSKLFNEICSVYINFVLKKPLTTYKRQATYSDRRKAIESIIGNIDNYVVAGFRSKHIETVIVDVKNQLKHVERHIPFQEYCHGVFKSKINYVIGKFVERYISILPDDLRKAIYKIENAIDDFVFVTLYELGFPNTPMPTSDEDILKLKKQLLIIGEQLLYIHDLINPENIE